MLCGVFKSVCETIKVMSTPSKWDISTLGVIGCEEKCQNITAFSVMCVIMIGTALVRLVSL